MFDSLVVFLCHRPESGGRLLRDGSASLSRDLLPPPCLLPAQRGTTVGRAPDGLFCHTLRNAIDCGSEKAIYSNLLGGRLGVKAARRECADVVNKIRPRAACKASLKGKWRDTTTHLIFPQSPGAIEIKGEQGARQPFFFFLPNIHAPCPLTTPPWFSSGQMPCSPFSSLWFTES